MLTHVRTTFLLDPGKLWSNTQVIIRLSIFRWLSDQLCNLLSLQLIFDVSNLSGITVFSSKIFHLLHPYSFNKCVLRVRQW